MAEVIKVLLPYHKELMKQVFELANDLSILELDPNNVAALDRFNARYELVQKSLTSIKVKANGLTTGEDSKEG